MLLPNCYYCYYGSYLVRYFACICLPLLGRFVICQCSWKPWCVVTFLKGREIDCSSMDWRFSSVKFCIENVSCMIPVTALVCDWHARQLWEVLLDEIQCNIISKQHAHRLHCFAILHGWNFSMSIQTFRIEELENDHFWDRLIITEKVFIILGSRGSKLGSRIGLWTSYRFSQIHDFIHVHTLDLLLSGWSLGTHQNNHSSHIS